MKRKMMLIAGIIYLVVIVEFVFYLSSDSNLELPDKKNKVEVSKQSISQKPVSQKNTRVRLNSNQASSQTAARPYQPIEPVKRPQDESNNQVTHSLASPSQDLFREEREIVYADVEDIKRKIYDMRIEYIEQLEELEDIVQTGDANQADFWEGDWHSVDDWKRRNDAFQLTVNDDGSFTFLTEDRLHQPSQAYTFDKETKEFNWEEDYYGKIISHRAKFITPSTLLIIKTSGIKVNLDIYEKAAQ